ncbi:Hypothetical protein Ccan_07780 [Capnocytophaga canimorsus Cc5]|uniref:Uncharacterized protein n=1 Tax=Capnocytophaga canimorsus (strain 5) TaxID=860228 RepID=F9YTW2_CAPCC|nr:Hypothetical protein Ccan_07780 [Capnocytophaga canimorsus Cc5]
MANTKKAFIFVLKNENLMLPNKKKSPASPLHLALPFN